MPCVTSEYHSGSPRARREAQAVVGEQHQPGRAAADHGDLRIADHPARIPQQRRRQPRDQHSEGLGVSCGRRGGELVVGAPAHLALVDPGATVTVDRAATASLSRNNPYHGRTFTGAVRTTILRGRVTAAAGEAHA